MDKGIRKDYLFFLNYNPGFPLIGGDIGSTPPPPTHTHTHSANFFNPNPIKAVAHPWGAPYLKMKLPPLKNNLPLHYKMKSFFKKCIVKKIQPSKSVINASLVKQHWKKLAIILQKHQFLLGAYRISTENRNCWKTLHYYIT